MEIVDILFFVFGALAVISALVVLLTRHILYAAFALVATFLSIAALYILSGAEFIAITQIMVYVGGIVVLLIFGVMLTNKISGKSMITTTGNRFWGIFIAAALGVIMIYAILQINFIAIGEQAPDSSTNLQQLGIGLMSDHLLAFEIAAFILLIALVGAATIAGHKSSSHDS